MDIQKLRRCLLGIPLGFLIACIIFLMVPLLGPSWHLIHGNLITYQGWRIPVPRGFYVTQKPDHCTMWKHTLGAPFKRTASTSIGILTNPSGKLFKFEGNLEESAERMIAAGQMDGYIFHSERTVSTGSSTAYCFEFYNQQAPSEFTARCAIENTAILFIYLGDDKSKEDLYSALEGLSRAGAPR